MTPLKLRIVTLSICAVIGIGLTVLSGFCILHLADYRYLGAFICTACSGAAMAEICALRILEVL